MLRGSTAQPCHLRPFVTCRWEKWGDSGLGDPGMPDDTKIQRPRPEMTRFSFDWNPLLIFPRFMHTWNVWNGLMLLLKIYIYIYMCVLQCITVLHSDSVWRCASICSAVLSAVVAELVFRSSVRVPGLRITFSWQASPNCKETWGKSGCVVSCAGTCSYKQIHNWAVRRVNSTTCSLCNDHEIRRPLHLSSRCFLDEFCFQII